MGLGWPWGKASPSPRPPHVTPVAVPAHPPPTKPSRSDRRRPAIRHYRLGPPIPYPHPMRKHRGPTQPLACRWRSQAHKAVAQRPQRPPATRHPPLPLGPLIPYPQPMNTHRGPTHPSPAAGAARPTKPSRSDPQESNQNESSRFEPARDIRFFIFRKMAIIQAHQSNRVRPLHTLPPQSRRAATAAQRRRATSLGLPGVHAEPPPTPAPWVPACGGMTRGGCGACTHHVDVVRNTKWCTVCSTHPGAAARQSRRRRNDGPI